jgi:hypothetical protein
VIIVADFGSDVQHYQSEFRHLSFPRPRNCPYCAAAKPLVGHGSYQRTACDEKRLFVIHVKRFFCTLCRHTVSLLPSFCLSYRHYLVSTIQTVLTLRFQTQFSWHAIGQRFSSSEVPSLSSCREWTARFALASEAYLKILLRQLATWQLAPGKLELALADIAEALTGPSQLLAAVPHLVAWLNDRGLMMVEGSKRWLSTLWQWGHKVKLGRLV